MAVYQYFRTSLLWGLFLLASPSFSQNQIQVGDWRAHLTYYNLSCVAQNNKEVFAASENALFAFDKNSQKIRTIGKKEGLSDTQISALAFHQERNFLFVGYANGNIDLYNESTCINIRTILNANLTHPRIHHVFFENQWAFISTDDGLVKLNLDSYKITSEYKNLNLGTRAAVFQASASADSIYLATDFGLISGKKTDNLQDFALWNRLYASAAIRACAFLPDGRLVSYLSATDSLLLYDNGTYTFFQLGQTFENSRVTIAENRVFLGAQASVLRFDPATTTTQVFVDEKIVSCKEVLLSSTGTIFGADRFSGLVKIGTDGQIANFFADGTISPKVYRIRKLDNKIIALSGGHKGMIADGDLSGFSVFEQNKWTNYTSLPNFIGAKNCPEVADWVDAVYDPRRNVVFLASFQHGLWRWDQQSGVFTKQAVAPDRLSSIHFDPQGNLWVLAFNQSPTVYVFKTDDTWQSFSFSSSIPLRGLELLTDGLGNRWIRPETTTGGLFAFDQSNQRVLSEDASNGDMPSRQVFSIAKDRNGSIWLGTSNGVARFDRLNDLFNGASVTLPIYEQGALLNGQIVQAIAVDAGNRKWLSTPDGLLLVSADGSDVLAEFNQENSPLLSNVVYDICVDDLSGEVFFATDKGIVSYRGTATSPDYLQSNVKIFPNPVQPPYSGLVSIEGLAQDCQVKITDISGKLIFETQSNGGMAVWDCKDYNGQKAQTGVYLVLSTTLDGLQTFVGKIVLVQ